MTVAESLQPLLDELCIEVFEKLPQNLYYHCLDHTLVVMQCALELAEAANLSTNDTRILYAAAALHDTGFGKKYGANEGVAAILADKLLPKYGFKKTEIKHVHNMILATNLLIAPEENLEMLLADADMGYLGKSDFMLWSNRLLQEWREHGRFSGSDNDWLQTQIQFLERYSYFSNEAQTLYAAGIAKNLNQLKQLTEWPF